MGTLTLRVVVPWRVNGKLVGYLEMGKEIDNVIDEMKKILDVDLLLVVNKMHLNKQSRKEGYGEGGQFTHWDQFPDVVVFGSTLDELPPFINKDLSRPHHLHKDLLMEFTVNSYKYIAGFAPLVDASEKDIGDIIIIKDFEAITKVAKNITLIVLAGFLVCILLYIAIIFIYLRRMKLKLIQIAEPDLSDD
jgi:two-component system NtrC family sensor kinase